MKHLPSCIRHCLRVMNLSLLIPIALAGCQSPSTSCPQIDAATGTEIAVEPCPGDYMTCGDSSPGMILEDVAVETSTCEQDYINLDPASEGIVRAGDPCLLIHGHVRNEHIDGYYVAINASGYDSMKNNVSWTLDAAHIPGSALISIDGQSVTDFILHLSFADDVSSITICSQSYSTPPP